MQTPTKGRIVHFRYLNERTQKVAIRPAIIVEVWSPECVNLQVFLDGHKEDPASNDGDGPMKWVTSSSYQAEDDGAEPRPRTWFWPPRT